MASSSNTRRTTNLASASQAAAQELWRELDTTLQQHDSASSAHALLSPLAALHASRQRLGALSDAQAASLAAALPRLLAGGEQAAAQGWPHALELLSRWAQSAHVHTISSTRLATPSASKPPPSSTTAVAAADHQQEKHIDVIAAASETVLSALQGRLCPAVAVGSALGFLGSAAAAAPAAAAPATADTAACSACAAAAESALHELGLQVCSVEVLPGVISGVQQLLGACLVSFGFLFCLLVCLV